MIKLYVDESGCFSKNPRSARHVIIAVVQPSDEIVLARTIKRVKRTINNQRKNKHKLKELKFHKLNRVERNLVLKKLAELDIKIYFAILHKETVDPKLISSPQWLYWYLLDFISSQAIYMNKASSILVHIDRFLPIKKIKKFDEQMKKSQSKKFSNAKLRIMHLSSESELCIQAADAIAGAAFQKYERGVVEYYDRIQDKIVTEPKFWKR